MLNFTVFLLPLLLDQMILMDVDPSNTLNIVQPRRVESSEEHPFIRLPEKIHRPPQHLKMLRLPVGHKFFLSIPFFQKKETVLFLDTLAEVAAPASLLHPCKAHQ